MNTKVGSESNRHAPFLTAAIFFATVVTTSITTVTSAKSLPNYATRIKAVKAVVRDNPKCRSIAPFYWEIGDRNGVIASGSTGDGRVVRTTTFGIASASKWVFATYVIQRFHGQLDRTTKKFLRMMSGYTSMRTFACIFTSTVEACENRMNNSKYSPENDGYFFYNGGHFQKWAVNHGLGPMNKSQLVAEYQKQLGSDFKFSIKAMQMAGLVVTSAKVYARFLQKILRGQLLMRRYLGENPTCTLPRVCNKAKYSPIPVVWHYSYGHWIEDDPQGDGAFSSPGAFGFYPWIDSSKTYYGIISRHQRPRRFNRTIGAGYASALCGHAMRQAFGLTK